MNEHRPPIRRSAGAVYETHYTLIVRTFRIRRKVPETSQVFGHRAARSPHKRRAKLTDVHSRWGLVGAWIAALAIALGAFGAHILRDRMTEQQLNWWQTGQQYLLYSAFGILAVGLAAERVRQPQLSATALLLGGLIFGGSLFGLALGGPRWLGAVAPVGGSLLIVGYLALGVALARRPS